MHLGEIGEGSRLSEAFDVFMNKVSALDAGIGAKRARLGPFLHYLGIKGGFYCSLTASTTFY